MASECLKMTLFSNISKLFAAVLLLQLFYFQFIEAENVTTLSVKPSATELVTRQNFIKNMTLEAWNFYKKYAWGNYSVNPIMKKAPHPLGEGTGATIVSSLTTLHLMGLTEQFNQSREWVSEHMDFKNIDSEVEVYRTITEHIGGLLSAYALTNDQLFLIKALEVGESIKGAFNTSKGLPVGVYRPKSARHDDEMIYTSKAAYEQPELYLLADLINNTFAASFSQSPSVSSSDLSSVLASASAFAIASAAEWRARLVKIRNLINSLEKPKGKNLIPNRIYVKPGSWVAEIALMTDESNEFFYNLIRSYILSSKRRAYNLELYRSTLLQSYREIGMFQTVGNGLLFPRSYDLVYNHIRNDSTYFSNSFHDSSCQLGALFALAGRELEKVAKNSSTETDKAVARYQWELARNLTKTCVYLTEMTKTKLLPDESWLNQTNGESGIFNSPLGISNTNFELAETYFIFWRLTREPLWRERAWKLAQAIQTHKKTPDGGYGRVKLFKVDSASPVPHFASKFDTYAQQDPQLISATFKYLYLTQVDDENVLSLDKYVFNAAGHPLPICGQHPLYPKSACSK